MLQSKADNWRKSYDTALIEKISSSSLQTKDEQQQGNKNNKNKKKLVADEPVSVHAAVEMLYEATAGAAVVASATQQTPHQEQEEQEQQQHRYDAAVAHLHSVLTRQVRLFGTDGRVNLSVDSTTTTTTTTKAEDPALAPSYEASGVSSDIVRENSSIDAILAQADKAKRKDAFFLPFSASVEFLQAEDGKGGMQVRRVDALVQAKKRTNDEENTKEKEKQVVVETVEIAQMGERESLLAGEKIEWMKKGSTLRRDASFFHTPTEEDFMTIGDETLRLLELEEAEGIAVAEQQQQKQKQKAARALKLTLTDAAATLLSYDGEMTKKKKSTATTRSPVQRTTSSLREEATNDAEEEEDAPSHEEDDDDEEEASEDSQDESLEEHEEHEEEQQEQQEAAQSLYSSLVREGTPKDAKRKSSTATATGGKKTKKRKKSTANPNTIVFQAFQVLSALAEDREDPQMVRFTQNQDITVTLNNDQAFVPATPSHTPVDSDLFFHELAQEQRWQLEQLVKAGGEEADNEQSIIGVEESEEGSAQQQQQEEEQDPSTRSLRGNEFGGGREVSIRKKKEVKKKKKNTIGILLVTAKGDLVADNINEKKPIDWTTKPTQGFLKGLSQRLKTIQGLTREKQLCDKAREENLVSPVGIDWKNVASIGWKGKKKKEDADEAQQQQGEAEEGRRGLRSRQQQQGKRSSSSQQQRRGQKCVFSPSPLSEYSFEAPEEAALLHDAPYFPHFLTIRPTTSSKATTSSSPPPPQQQQQYRPATSLVGTTSFETEREKQKPTHLMTPSEQLAEKRRKPRAYDDRKDRQYFTACYKKSKEEDGRKVARPLSQNDSSVFVGRVMNTRRPGTVGTEHDPVYTNNSQERRNHNPHASSLLQRTSSEISSTVNKSSNNSCSGHHLAHQAHEVVAMSNNNNNNDKKKSSDAGTGASPSSPSLLLPNLSRISASSAAKQPRERALEQQGVRGGGASSSSEQHTRSRMVSVAVAQRAAMKALRQQEWKDMRK